MAYDHVSRICTAYLSATFLLTIRNLSFYRFPGYNVSKMHSLEHGSTVNIVFVENMTVENLVLKCNVMSICPSTSV